MFHLWISKDSDLSSWSALQPCGTVTGYDRKLMSQSMNLTLDEDSRSRYVRRNTALLAAAQASIWMTIGVFVAAGPIAIVRFSGRTGLGGLVFALWSVSVAAGAQLGGLIMDRSGRRPGLSLGQALLAAASATAALSVLNGSTVGVLGSAVVGGLGSGAALLGRAAVADMYPIEKRGVAVGFMLAAGTVGAIIGPQLVQVTGLLTHSGRASQLAAAWFITAAVSVVAFGCVAALRPDPRDLAPPQRDRPPTARRPFATLLQLPALRAAILAIALAQLAMVGLMAIYSVALSARGIALAVIALVLSAHFAGMFAFSPAWGVFLDRVGRRQVLLAGAALVVIGALIIGLPAAAVSAAGLFLVGLGWSGSYVGATAVVSDLTAPAERGTVLGFTDLLSSGAGAIGALTAGVILASSGFQVAGLCACVVLLGALALIVLVPHSSWRARLATA